MNLNRPPQTELQRPVGAGIAASWGAASRAPQRKALQFASDKGCGARERKIGLTGAEGEK
jgi:hypothetical protein